MYFQRLKGVACGCVLLAMGVGWLNLPLNAASPGFGVRSYESESGLPQNTVNSIVQTRDGYLWLGTEGGLARFDGVRFTTFGLRDGLRSLQIKKLLEDREGTLWMAIRGGGVGRLINGRIESLGRAEGLASDYAFSLAEDWEGGIWIATTGGLNRYKNGKIERLGEKEGLMGQTIRRLFVDHGGVLWVVMSDGVFQYLGGRFESVSIPFLAGYHRTFYCMLEDRQGRIWGSNGDGMVFCRRDGKWTIYDMANGLPYAYITCLEEDQEGRIWAGSLDEGLYYLDGDRFVKLNTSNGLSDVAIRSLYNDREGNLWVGTRVGGLNRLTRKFVTSIGAEDGLAHEYVRSLAESADGQKWICTTGGGMYSGKEGRFASVSETDEHMRFFAASESVVATRDGSVWLGGWGALMRLRNGILQTGNFYTQKDWPWLRDDSVMALCEDNVSGLWLGSYKSGLRLFRDGKLTSYGPEISVTSILQGTNGVVWFGSVDGGLFELNNGKIKGYGEQPGLLNTMIRALYMDSEGTLWIGTTGGGLSRYRQGYFNSFTTREGLVEDTVSQILEDETGHLWLGGNHGIARVDKAELNAVASRRLGFVSPLVFSKSSGMPAEECSSGSSPNAFKSRSGQLCFATVKGVVMINPSQITVDQSPPRVKIEDIYRDGNLVPHSEWRPDQPTPRELSSAAEEPSPTPPLCELILPAGGARLDIRFTAFSFASPEAVRFKYKIDGLEPEWSIIGGQRSLNLWRLPHGEYTLHLLACNNNGVWNTEGDKLRIVVPPRLWENAWVVSLVVVLGCLSIGLFASYWVRRQYLREVERLEHLHAMEHERARIAQDLHDDLGNSLTEISLLGTLARSSAPQNTELSGYLAEITDKSRQLVKALDEIVWAVNPKNDKLSDLVHYLCLFAQDFLQLTSIRCRLDVSRDMPEIVLDSERRHGLFLAVKEALNNAAKHSQARELWLRFDERNNVLKVAVEDNGKGFSIEELPPGRNGLDNMRRRMERLGGSCTFDSKPGRGTRICFILPFDPNAKDTPPF
jgi:ligand-binding sensor domain-containing protein/signal transduction histidine kinase